MAETLAVLLLVATLACAVARPRGWPEAVFAVPAALLLLLPGVLSLSQAGAEARSLGPTIGFLAAVLVLADMSDRYGLFEAAGTWMASRLSRQAGRAPRPGVRSRKRGDRRARP